MRNHRLSQPTLTGFFSQRRAYETIVNSAKITCIACIVFIALIVPATGIVLLGFKPVDAGGRMLMGLIFSVIASPAFVCAGTALGCLTVPNAFLSSSAGAVWMRLIGARSHSQARLICWLLVLAVIGLISGLAFMLLTMAPFVH
jgi:hypothetical protein